MTSRTILMFSAAAAAAMALAASGCDQSKQHTQKTQDTQQKQKIQGTQNTQKTQGTQHTQEAANESPQAFAGQITWFGGVSVPPGWARCDGTLLEGRSNPAILSVLGQRFGGDEQMIALPDLRTHDLHPALKCGIAVEGALPQSSAPMPRPFLGQITMFGGDHAPPGWAACDGQVVSISSNQALFSILGTSFGGDGRSTFALPDLRKHEDDLRSVSSTAGAPKFIIAVDGAYPSRDEVDEELSEKYGTSTEPFVGQVSMFGGNYAPAGWAKCEGQVVSISSNQALFSIIGTSYGGDGRTTFGLPDLREHQAQLPASGRWQGRPMFIIATQGLIPARN